MKEFFCALLLGLLCLLPSMAEESSPKVQVYTRTPGELGVKNTLICHVSGFHPPEITIQLLEGGVEIPGAKQTDLAFEENWHYHLTRHVIFIPNKDKTYACSVTHMGKHRTYVWEPDM